jgi:hypothetical protein
VAAAYLLAATIADSAPYVAELGSRGRERDLIGIIIV